MGQCRSRLIPDKNPSNAVSSSIVIVSSSGDDLQLHSVLKKSSSASLDKKWGDETVAPWEQRWSQQRENRKESDTQDSKPQSVTPILTYRRLGKKSNSWEIVNPINCQKLRKVYSHSSGLKLNVSILPIEAKAINKPLKKPFLDRLQSVSETITNGTSGNGMRKNVSFNDLVVEYRFEKLEEYRRDRRDSFVKKYLGNLGQKQYKKQFSAKV